MKIIAIIIGAVILASVCCASEKSQEAKVNFKKEDQGIRYNIQVEKPFKINTKAPFKFELKNNKNELVKKVPLDQFAAANEQYEFLSTMGEQTAQWWFIACRYKGDEVTACKTFAGSHTVR